MKLITLSGWIIPTSLQHHWNHGLYRLGTIPIWPNFSDVRTNYCTYNMCIYIYIHIYTHLFYMYVEYIYIYMYIYIYIFILNIYIYLFNYSIYILVYYIFWTYGTIWCSHGRRPGPHQGQPPLRFVKFGFPYRCETSVWAGIFYLVANYPRILSGW